MEFTAVTHTTTSRVDYTDIESDLDEARYFSLEKPKNTFLRAEVEDRGKFNGQLRTYALDHGLKVSRKRSTGNVVEFRFVPLNTDEDAA